MKRLCVIEKSGKNASIGWGDSALFDLVRDLAEYEKFYYKVEYENNRINIYKDGKLRTTFIIKEMNVDDLLK